MIIEYIKWLKNGWMNESPSESRSKSQYLLLLLSSNKAFWMKEKLPREIPSKQYLRISMQRVEETGETEWQLAFSNLFSEDTPLFTLLNFSESKRATLFRLLILKKSKEEEWAEQGEDLKSTQSFVISSLRWWEV